MIDDDDECGAVGGMRIGKGNRSTRRKPALVPLCPPRIPRDLASNRGRRGEKPGTNHSELWQRFFFNLCGGTLGTAATAGLLYQPQMIGEGDCGEIGGMNIGRGERSTRRKPAPAPLCPPLIPHD
jgi:hypothetical protein